MKTNFNPNLRNTAASMEQAARDVMDYDRARPGMFEKFLNQDYAAVQAIAVIIDDAIDDAHSWDDTLDYRTSQVDPALSASSAKARTAAGLQPGQAWIAHHLIPFNVVAKLPRPFQVQMVASGWSMDMAVNVIALPGNFAAFSASGRRWPYHSGSHPRYDADAALRMSPLVPPALAGITSPSDLFKQIAGVDGDMLTRIVTYIYHEKVP